MLWWTMGYLRARLLVEGLGVRMRKSMDDVAEFELDVELLIDKES